MARVIKPTIEQERGWHEWVITRPPPVRAVARRFDPWTLYSLKGTDCSVTLLSFYYDETAERVKLKVAVDGETVEAAQEGVLCGVDPDDLSEAEPVGMSEDDAPFLIDEDEINAEMEIFRDALCHSRPS